LAAFIARLRFFYAAINALFQSDLGSITTETSSPGLAS
jgi:hypothetical protein